MHISRLTLLALFGTLLFSSAPFLPAHATEPRANGIHIRHGISRRDLIGSVFPPSNQPASPPPPASPPVSPPATNPSVAPVPQAPSPSSSSSSSGSTSNATKTGGAAAPIPSLIGDILNNNGASSSPVSSTISAGDPTSRRKPSGSGSSSNNQDDSSPPDEPNASPGTSTPSTAAGNPSTVGDGHTLLTEIIALVAIAVLAAVLFVCYKIRQSRQRRRQSWDEDILKNHASNVGYTEGAGYGMYVGSSSKERPDLWRKDLDMFHRQ